MAQEKNMFRNNYFIFLFFALYNSSNPVSELNKVITSLIDSCIPSRFIKQKVNDKAWFNEDCVNAFHNKQNLYHFWLQNRSLFS